MTLTAASSTKPVVPSFETVPAHWKYPQGPYHQAPPEWGGRWWLVNPFVGGEPWVLYQTERPPEELPDGFVEIFGARPKHSDFPNDIANQQYRSATAKWEQDLKHFREAGAPPWAEPEAIKAATAVYMAWQMGAPRFYLGRYDWSARFVDSALPDYDAGAMTAISHPHLIIANYQIRMFQEGLTPDQRHPFVPPYLDPATDDDPK